VKPPISWGGGFVQPDPTGGHIHDEIFSTQRRSHENAEGKTRKEIQPTVSTFKGISFLLAAEVRSFGLKEKGFVQQSTIVFRSSLFHIIGFTLLLARPRYSPPPEQPASKEDAFGPNDFVSLLIIGAWRAGIRE